MLTHTQSRSGSKIRSTTNGSNTQFSASASKPRAPNHLCPQEMADPPVSASRICEHTRGGGVGVSKSARLRSATAPRMCECSFMLKQSFLNTLRSRQNGHHFTDNIFKCIFLNENVQILIIILLKFVPKDQIKNIPTVIQTMAWHGPGDKPLSEPMMF